MNTQNNRLLHALFAVLLSSASNIVLSKDNASNISKSYSTNFMQNKGLIKIFKFTDNNGKITYSTSIPDDFIEAEEIAVSGPPSNRHIEETKQINGVLKTTAEKLGEAHEKREVIRDEKERKRLERLALINRSKPPVVYQKNTYVAYPYRSGSTQFHNGHKQHPYQPVHLPVRVHYPSYSPFPVSGVSHIRH